MRLTTLTPTTFGLVLAGVLAALTILHFLRVRPRRKVVPTLLFWQEATRRTQARTLMQRLRHPLAWLLSALLLSLLVLAFADPQRAPEEDSAEHAVVLLDLEPGLPADRLEAMRTVARELLIDRPLAHPVAIVEAAGATRLLKTFEGPRPAVAQSLSALTPGMGWTPVPELLQLLQGLSEGRSGARWHVLTSRPQAFERFGVEERVTVHPVALPTDDMALLAVHWTDRAEVLVDRGVAKTARQVVVRDLDVADAAKAVLARADVPAGRGEVRVAIADLPEDGRRLRFALEAADSAPGNDAVELLGPERPIVSLAVTPAEYASGILAALVAEDPYLQFSASDTATLKLEVLPGRVASAARSKMHWASYFAEGGARRPPLPPLSPKGALTREQAFAFEGNDPGSGTHFPLLENEAGVLASAYIGRSLRLLTDLLSPTEGLAATPEGLAVLAALLREAGGHRPATLMTRDAAPHLLEQVVSVPRQAVRLGDGQAFSAPALLSPCMLSEGQLLAGAAPAALAPFPAAVAETPTVKPEVQKPGFALRPFEWLLLGALLLLLLDGWAYGRRRIP